MAAKFVDRIATTDNGYRTGDLSIYPVAKDDYNQLYVVTNNAKTYTTQSVSYNSPYFIVADTSAFPDKGLIMVGTEQVYYDLKTPNSFRNLKRGFANSRQDQWPINTTVSGAVCAEPHNAIKDALINTEINLGVEVNPAAASLNGILKALETRFYSPRPVFRGGPRFGFAPFTVKFQNFSEGPAIRYFWEFGDGATSQETSPTHTYVADGVYTVTLNMITSLGAQGVVVKNDYINVGLEFKPAFFYFTPTMGTTSTTFEFVDQTDGEVNSRYWVWDDGTTTAELDADDHTATHQYTAAGTYNPSLLVIFANGKKKLVKAQESLIVG